MEKKSNVCGGGIDNPTCGGERRRGIIQSLPKPSERASPTSQRSHPFYDTGGCPGFHAPRTPEEEKIVN
ncbi:hypothetical protein HNY73_012510 [Argiope bruennichi]|uniref:Uncharacterized protein n=1 Tax=Argiope bruennichi TaxID=94029 RepID=A0A8T0EZM1_ARGBR|nr:hypothetical protein HNY73_012510 [Argiope bruennichi]